MLTHCNRRFMTGIVKFSQLSTTHLTNTVQLHVEFVRVESLKQFRSSPAKLKCSRFEVMFSTKSV